MATLRQVRVNDAVGYLAAVIDVLVLAWALITKGRQPPGKAKLGAFKAAPSTSTHRGG